MIAEFAEVLSLSLSESGEAMFAMAARATELVRRLRRHAVVHGLMPVVNFRSRRAYVQYRPDGLEDRFDEIASLQLHWERGRRGNNRGDYARLYFFIATLEGLREAQVLGDIAEVGVFKGSTARLLHHMAPERKLYLFDTFGGFPEQHASSDPSSADPGGYASSLDEVRRFVGEHPNIVYCEGIFPDTAFMVPDETSFALVHLDCDLYLPTMAALEFFYPRMEPGGVLVLHDYGSGCWPGVKRAADEFLADKPEGLVRVPDKSGTAALTRARQGASHGPR